MKGSSSDTAIIITGKKRGGPRQLADYLMDMGENEAFRVCEINCFVAKNIKDALAEMWAVADGCKAKDFIYHATLNPRPGITLSEKQWKESIDALEKKLNLVGHQRVVVEHTKKGRIHRHVAWNRVDPKTGIVKKLSFDRRKLRATAVELTEKFGLTPTPNVGQSYKRSHIERGKRTGIDPKIVKAQVTALWNQSKSGQEFAAALAKRGYILARGDKSQFVLIDRAGSIHGLTRRIDGATAKTVRRGMVDVDINTLPTIAEAKAQVKARQTKHGGIKRKGSGKARTKGTTRRRYRKYGTTTKRYRTKRGTTSPAKAWQHYGFYQTSRGPGVTAKTRTNGLTAAPQKNQIGSSSATPTIDRAKSGIGSNTGSINPSNTKGQGGKTGGTGTTQGTAKKNLGTTNVNLPPAIAPGKQNHGAAPPSPNQTPNPLSPAVNPLGSNWKTGKDGKPEQTNPAPFRPTNTSGMCEAQRIDLEAAQAGKMPWPDYYRKWGNGNGPAP